MAKEIVTAMYDAGSEKILNDVAKKLIPLFLQTIRLNGLQAISGVYVFSCDIGSKNITVSLEDSLESFSEFSFQTKQGYKTIEHIVRYRTDEELANGLLKFAKRIV